MANKLRDRAFTGYKVITHPDGVVIECRFDSCHRCDRPAGHKGNAPWARPTARVSGLAEARHWAVDHAERFHHHAEDKPEPDGVVGNAITQA